MTYSVHTTKWISPSEAKKNSINVSWTFLPNGIEACVNAFCIPNEHYKLNFLIKYSHAITSWLTYWSHSVCCNKKKSANIFTPRKFGLFFQPPLINIKVLQKSH